MRKNTVRALCPLLALALFAAATPAWADASEDPPEFLGVRPGAAAQPEQLRDQPIEQLALPMVSDEMMMEASALLESFDGHRQMGSVGVSEDRSRIEVYWHGARPENFERALDALSTPVDIRMTDYEPGLLRDIASDLISGEAGPDVASVAIAPDGSGLAVSLKEGGAARAAAPDPAVQQEAVREFAGVPVDFVAAPESATSRQSDTAGMGGARIWQFDNGRIINACTTAFAVIRPDSSRKGVLTAAHCSDIGARWVVHDGVDGSNSYYLLGDVVSRGVTYDAAVIDSTWSYPYIYTGAWDSNTYTPINGMTIPVVGIEICYSGSYSGLACGNIVRIAETVNQVCDPYGANCMAVRAFQTEHHTGVPTVGQGDSGGPGYVLTNTPSGVKRYAATIISAIRGGSSACSGIGGGRSCSATVLSTSVVEALRANGWALQVLN
jgi:hypothetical protein